jgi:hypothetical protein
MRTARFCEFSSIKWPFYFSAFIIFFTSCTRKDDFTIGRYFTEDQTSLRIVDTFTVAMSTVMADSLFSSGTGTMLVGTYSDTCFGSVNAISYFEPGYRHLDLEPVNIFDSASIALVYSGYSYGDTTAPLSLSIYQLDEEITSSSNTYIYNHTDFKYSNKLIGSKTFYAEPHSPDTIYIPCNSFGEQLFNMFRDNDPDMGSAESMLNFLNGFVVRADFGNSIVGFKADASEILLEFYYHEDGQTVNTSVVYIPFGLARKQFNSVHTDFTSTLLSAVLPDDNAVSSLRTGNIAYMQAMVGLFPKLTFPTMQNITFENNWKILKAELVFKPVVGSYSTFTLPDRLCLCRTDNKNQVGSVLAGSDGSTIYSVLTTDDMFNDYTNYTIDITSYLNDQLADNYFDSNNGLMVSLLSSDLNKSFSRLMIECKNKAVKLRLYCLYY